MRDQTRATEWTCDSTAPSGGCESSVTRADLYQDVPPEGWRVIRVVPVHVNLALEATPHRMLVLCSACYAESGLAERTDP